MAKKEYTHSKGFNVTSLKGISGIYFFLNQHNEITYIGMCDDDFKNRINSHSYGHHGKLSSDIDYMSVIIADPLIYPLHVLEHLFIRYFAPIANHAYWIFNRCNDEVSVKKVAKEHGINIIGSLEEFILSFDSILIEREREERFGYKRYGEKELLSSKRVLCNGNKKCLCLPCLVKRKKGYY